MWTASGSPSKVVGVCSRTSPSPRGPGTLTAVIGPSGAGKTTVAKIISGAASPTEGVVEFDGRSVHTEYSILRSRIGMVPQDDVVHRQLTLRGPSVMPQSSGCHRTPPAPTVKR